MSEQPKTPAPVVDPSPHAPPIQLGSTEYVFPPAAASPDEVLALKPNDAASATEGAHEQISPTAYVTWTKPDGGTFIAPLSNSETYERKGYKKGAEQEIPDLVAYLAEQAGKEPAKAKEPATAAPKTTTTTAKAG